MDVLARSYAEMYVTDLLPPAARPVRHRFGR